MIVMQKRSTAGSQSPGTEARFARRAFVAASIAAGVGMCVLLLWYAVDVLLLVFAGVLVGVILRGLSRVLTRHTALSHGWALAVVLIALLIVTGLLAWLLAERIAEQASMLVDALPRALEELTAHLGSYTWGERLLAELPPPNKWSELFSARSGGVFGRITGIASSVLSTIVNVVIVICIALYLAAEPRTYRRGVLHLVPPRHRRRTSEVLAELDTNLGRWLIGRLVLMVINGSLTATGLWLLDVPLALTLGILTGVLNFIPNFGPLIAGAPAVLIALLTGSQTALYTMLLYVAVQMLDGYVFTPLMDKRSVELPPVLTITAQVLLGVLVGGAGVVLASPLIASLIVVVRMLYVEDTLGDSTVSKKDES